MKKLSLFVLCTALLGGCGGGSSNNSVVTNSSAIPAGVGPVDSDVQATGKWVMAYYVGYQQNLQPITEIDFSNLTHLVVGRVAPNADGTLIKTFDIDATKGPIFAKAAAQAAHDAGKKAVLMVGGAGTVDGWRGAASVANRAMFVKNLLDAMDQLGFDGLDMDWEPLDYVVGFDDRTPMLELVKALRTARPTMILTIPVGWNYLDSMYKYGEISAYVDRVNLMTYGMASAYWGWSSWHSAALYGPAEPADTTSSIKRIVNMYRSAGVADGKINVGIGFYGDCWRNVNGLDQAQPAGAASAGDPNDPFIPINTQYVLPAMGGNDNVMSYKNIIELYYPSSTVFSIYAWDDVAKMPYLHSSDAFKTSAFGPEKCNFVSYENASSIAAKGNYVKAEGLGGALVWTISQGYFPNAATKAAKEPLMQAVQKGFLH